MPGDNRLNGDGTITEKREGEQVPIGTYTTLDFAGDEIECTLDDGPVTKWKWRETGTGGEYFDGRDPTLEKMHVLCAASNIDGCYIWYWTTWRRADGDSPWEQTANGEFRRDWN